MTDLHGPIEIWRNVSPTPNHWITLSLQGTRSNRDAIGARLKLVTAAGARYSLVNTAVGYGSASDRRVHFGLGKDERILKIEITWPSGTTQLLENVAVDQFLSVKEPAS